MTTLLDGTNGALIEHARRRRALLDAIAEGEASLLILHDRLRTRGIRVLDDPRAIYGLVLTLVESGLVRVRGVPDGTGFLRRFYSITDAGHRERERLGVP